MADPLGLITAGVGSFQPAAPRAVAHGLRGESPSFKEALTQEIRKVADLQRNADLALAGLAAGARDDVENVMLATQRADAAFRMLLQVRNRVVEAYEEVKQVRV